jgi:hypothetical protein
MSNHPYSVQLTHKSARGLFPALRGELFENGVRVATFQRGAVRDHFVPPIEVKFLSERAQQRFVSFTDCLSVEETIEALMS